MGPIKLHWRNRESGELSVTAVQALPVPPSIMEKRVTKACRILLNCCITKKTCCQYYGTGCLFFSYIDGTGIRTDR